VTLAAGDTVAPFTVHRRIEEPVSSGDLLAERPAVFHFHIFDFTGNLEAG
jgi:hypothetical protein